MAGIEARIPAFGTLFDPGDVGRKILLIRRAGGSYDEQDVRHSGLHLP